MAWFLAWPVEKIHLDELLWILPLRYRIRRLSYGDFTMPLSAFENVKSIYKYDNFFVFSKFSYVRQCVHTKCQKFLKNLYFALLNIIKNYYNYKNFVS